MFRPFVLEEWFARYEHKVKYNIAESGMEPIDLRMFNLPPKDMVFRYGYLQGDPELRSLIARDYHGMASDNVMVTSGAIEANFVAIAAVVRPGDQVIVEHPNYQQLYEVPQALGCKVDLVDLRFEEGYQLNLDRVAKMITPETRLIIVSHPHNPTGSMITGKMLRDVIGLVEDHNAYILSDEVYRELAFTNPLPPAATLSSRAISVTSVSKLFGLPGLRIGWLVASDEIMEKARVPRSYTTLCNSLMSEQLAKAALRRKRQFLDRAKRIADINLKMIKRWIEEREDLDWVIPAGGVVAFPRYSHKVASTELCQLLAKRYKTLLVPGSCFEVENHFRIGFGGDTSQLRAGTKMVNKALDEVSSKQ